MSLTERPLAAPRINSHRLLKEAHLDELHVWERIHELELDPHLADEGDVFEQNWERRRDKPLADLDLEDNLRVRLKLELVRCTAGGGQRAIKRRAGVKDTCLHILTCR